MRPLVFALQPPRNPLLRLLLAVAGVALLGFFTVFGLIAAAGIAAVLAVRHMLLRLRGVAPAAGPRPSAAPDVIEGEFSVVDKPRTPLTWR